MIKLIRTFNYSAGAVLLAWATILILSTFQATPSDFVPARDFLFHLPLPVLNHIVAGFMLIGALLCLYSRQPDSQLSVIFWITANLIAYRIGLYFLGAKGGVDGYMGRMADLFGISDSSASWLLSAPIGFIFLGSVACTLLIWGYTWLGMANPALKMVCACCGGHIEFFKRNLGQMISCPHCQNSITLRRTNSTLKMACFFCKEHIEFPAHALGERITCPHCRMGITLKEAV